MTRAEQPDPIPRVKVADGTATVEAFDSPHVGPSDPAAEAVRAALAGGLHWFRANAPKARSGDATGVHQLRVTTRRLRTTLALFRHLTEPDWADGLSDECKWLAASLGAVRDLDVLSARLVEAAGEVGVDPEGVLRPLFDDLKARHDAASDALRKALRSERFARLDAALAHAADNAPLAEGAWEPCRKVLPPLVDDAWKPLKHAGRDLEPDSPDEAFHEVRKRAKRARYAAEAVRDALDDDHARDARRFARRARDVQEALGAHQDAVVSSAEIRRSAEERPGLGPFNFAAGRLLEREARASAETRDRFFDVWRDLDRKKVVRWLKG